MLFAAVRRSLMAQSGHSNRSRVCPLLDNSGQNWILDRDGLSANDPKPTSHLSGQLLPLVRLAARVDFERSLT
jgi:hypothetical protein